MQDMRGKVKRSVRVLRVLAPRAANLAAGGKIVVATGEREIGVGTSVAYSERAGAWLVMAGVQLDALDGELRHVGPTGSHPAAIAELI
jgi:glycine cleavage system aminomethyltransferase T